MSDAALLILDGTSIERIPVKSNDRLGNMAMPFIKEGKKVFVSSYVSAYQKTLWYEGYIQEWASVNRTKREYVDWNILEKEELPEILQMYLLINN